MNSLLDCLLDKGHSFLRGPNRELVQALDENPLLWVLSDLKTLLNVLDIVHLLLMCGRLCPSWSEKILNVLHVNLKQRNRDLELLVFFKLNIKKGIFGFCWTFFKVNNIVTQFFLYYLFNQIEDVAQCSKHYSLLLKVVHSALVLRPEDGVGLSTSSLKENNDASQYIFMNNEEKIAKWAML